MLTATFTVTAEEAGTRFDATVLAHCPDSTRGLVREAIARGFVTLNGAPSPKGARVHEGDAIAIESLPTADENVVRPDEAVAKAIASRIVYDDGTLLAIDKPAGMPVQPLSTFEEGTLAGGVVALRPEFSVAGHEPLAAGAVHRIDAATSGLVVFAANNFVFAAMRALFSEHKVAKRYLALVEGTVTRPGSVACELSHDPHLDYCRMVDYSALSAGERRRVRPLFAETRFAPMLEGQALHFKGRTLLSVEIATGVTHQIRAQLAMAGHPIVGDHIYGGAERKGAETLCLHSLSATFIHPATGAEITLAAPPPAWAGLC